MRRLEPVIWTKGTFLSPQHLQIQDRFLENLLRFQLDSLVFRAWGFRRLQIDQEALAGGTFAIASASGIFPDGLLFDIPASDAAPPVKIMAECFEPDQNDAGRLPGRSRLPRPRPQCGRQPPRRRHALPRRIRAVPRRKHRAYREAGAGGAQELPPAGGGRIARRSCSPCVWRAWCAPPAGSSSSIRTSCRRCWISPPATTYVHRPPAGRDPVRASSSTLSGMRRQKNQTPGGFHRLRHRQFLAALHHQYAFPAFRHIFESRGGHPEVLCRSMLSLAGCADDFFAQDPSARSARLRP